VAPASSPPVVVSLERAWQDLMQTLIFRNPGLVRQQKIADRAIRSLMARR
jgi:hypothetical protein